MIVEGGDNGGKKKKGMPKPPDGGWGWWVVFASFLIHVIADGVAYTFGLFFVKIVDDLGASKGATSWISSIMAGMTYGSGPIAGALVNKFGCRITSIIGSFIAAFGFAISFFAQSASYLIVSIGLVGGLGLGLIYLPAIVSVTSYFDKRRAFATGIAVCGSGFGTTLLAPVIEFLIRHFEWRFALVITGGIVFSCFFFSLFFRPLKETEEDDDGVMPHHPSIVEPDVQKPLLQTPEHIGSPDSAVEPMEKQCFAVQYLKPNNNETLTMSCSQPALRGVIGSFDSLQQFDPTRKRHSLRMNSFGKGIDQNQNNSDTPGLIISRKDIFYSGSLLKIPEATKGTQNGSCRTLEVDLIMMKSTLDEQKRKRMCCGICPCPAEIKEAFNSMTDFTILRDPIFLFFAFSNFFTSIGYNVPYIYLVDMAIGDRANPIHSTEDGSFLLAIVGAANTISRVVLGYLSDKPWVNRLYLYNGALAVCGIVTALAPHVLMDLNALRICSAMFGATVGVYVSLTSVILVDLLGLEKLTNAFGLLLLFQGVATVIGPPIVGALCDHFNNHKYGFGLAGGMIAISGIMLFLIPMIQRKYSQCEESCSEATTEQQEIASGKQSCTEINGTIKSDHNQCSNGMCNGTTKYSNNNIANV